MHRYFAASSGNATDDVIMKYMEDWYVDDVADDDFKADLIIENTRLLRFVDPNER